MSLRKATVEELETVLTAKDSDTWYEINHNLRGIIDRKEEAWRAISGLGLDRITAEATIAKFAERLAENPNDAFSWGAGAIEASGTVTLAGEVVYWLNNATGFNFKKLIAQMTKEVIRQRGYGPASSTSGISNLAEEYKHTAKAKWVEKVCEARV